MKLSLFRAESEADQRMEAGESEADLWAGQSNCVACTSMRTMKHNQTSNLALSRSDRRADSIGRSLRQLTVTWCISSVGRLCSVRISGCTLRGASAMGSSLSSAPIRRLVVRMAVGFGVAAGVAATCGVGDMVAGMLLGWRSRPVRSSG